MKKRKNSVSRSAKTKKQSIRNISLIFAALFLLVLALFFGNRRSGMVEPGNGTLAIPVSTFDFGDVSIKKGVVTKEFPLANVGDDPLVITFLDSSCGCTSARVINKGESGPIFGMSSHGKSPTNWETTIEPGEQAILKVYYDPSVHPDFRGRATRVITVSTNSLKTLQNKVTIKVNQID
jgi:hypothetical protein